MRRACSRRRVLSTGSVAQRLGVAKAPPSRPARFVLWGAEGLSSFGIGARHSRVALTRQRLWPAPAPSPLGEAIPAGRNRHRRVDTTFGSHRAGDSSQKGSSDHFAGPPTTPLMRCGIPLVASATVVAAPSPSQPPSGGGGRRHRHRRLLRRGRLTAASAVVRRRSSRAESAVGKADPRDLRVARIGRAEPTAPGSCGPSGPGWRESAPRANGPSGPATRGAIGISSLQPFGVGSGGCPAFEPSVLRGH